MKKDPQAIHNPSSPPLNLRGGISLDPPPLRLRGSEGELRLSEESSKTHWRSLDELAQTEEFAKFAKAEFPSVAGDLNKPLSRRKFLGLMGASLGMAGLVSCRRPVEKIIPYVIQPEEVVPGVALHYATSMPVGTSALGLMVESHEGRPTKIEGNPAHSTSLGATNSFAQAEILNLYDPDRSKEPLNKGQAATWEAFLEFWKGLLPTYQENGGDGLAVLSEAFSSPSLARSKELFHQVFPNAGWATYDPVSDETIFEGIELATGKGAVPLYRFDQARVILSLDHDFLHLETDNVFHARNFAEGRRVRSEKDPMNRLYVVEAAMSITGSMADHRLRIRSSQVIDFAVALAGELGRQGLNLSSDLRSLAASKKLFENAATNKWLPALAKDLLANRGSSLITAGQKQPPAVHALTLALNQALGNVGHTIELRPPTYQSRSHVRDLVDLAGRIRQGTISTLIILGGNPVYNAPADLDFGDLLGKLEHTVHLSQFVDETSRLAEWHLPRAHFLESWGDARATDETLSIIQPLIAPLYGGLSSLELLSVITSGVQKSGYDIVRETWQTLTEPHFEGNWEQSLHDGLLSWYASSPLSAPVNEREVARAVAHSLSSRTQSGSTEILFTPSATTYDGRYANNAWLQELPDPITKLTWDNAALVSPLTATRLGLHLVEKKGKQNSEIVKLTVGDASLEIPAWIAPGLPDDVVVVPLGYGRTAAGHVGNKIGANAYLLRTSQNPSFASGVTIEKTSKKYLLASTQDHGAIDGRPIVREATLKEYQENPAFTAEAVEVPPLQSLWKDFKYKEGNQWGMAIDLNTCIGCGGCTIACQSENNIPVVGKAQVAKGREMSWIRVDRYFSESVDEPKVAHQPMPCQHCETAPCEQVCPVAATVHDKEGLNVMVYNRCIGTKYCGNNCPYKVRRFNYFNFTKDATETEKMQRNPDVTVRFRGVMEKCTYCTQRISEAKITAKLEGRDVRDGDVKTACQQVCPTDAIVFGNINDVNSRVSQLKAQNRNYAVLAEINTRPRTTYLSKLRNPNPELENI